MSTWYIYIVLQFYSFTVLCSVSPKSDKGASDSFESQVPYALRLQGFKDIPRCRAESHLVAAIHLKSHRLASCVFQMPHVLGSSTRAVFLQCSQVKISA